MSFNVGDVVKKPRGRETYKIINIGNFRWATEFLIENLNTNRLYYYNNKQMSTFVVIQKGVIDFMKYPLNVKHNFLED